jgi:putative MFS transporter
MQIIEGQAGYEGPTLVPAVDKSNKDPQPVSIAVLFLKAVLRRTLLAVSATVMCLFGNYSLTAWMPTFFVSQGMSVAHSLFFNAAMMAGWIAGPLIAIFISDRIGRRWGIVLFGVLCAMLASAYPFVDTAFAIVLCGFLLVSAVSTFSNFALGGSAELFPTEYRFRGSGFSQMMGRLCLIASPFIVLYMFGRFGIAGVVLLIAAGYLAVALLMAIAGIETNGQSLEALEPNARTGSGKAMPQTVPSR